MKNKLIIFGCGGHARSATDIVLYNKPEMQIVFIDENARENETIYNFPVIQDADISEESVFVAIGDNQKRLRIAKKYYMNLISIISPLAYLGKDVKIGIGGFVGHHAHIGILSQIGDFVIVNTSAVIDHECVIDEGCFLAPNSTLCGKVRLGRNVFIGAGATLIDNIFIGDNITVGAGATVLHSLEIPGIYIGCPAKLKG